MKIREVWDSVVTWVKASEPHKIAAIIVISLIVGFLAGKIS